MVLLQKKFMTIILEILLTSNPHPNELITSHMIAFRSVSVPSNRIVCSLRKSREHRKLHAFSSSDMQKASTNPSKPETAKFDL